MDLIALLVVLGTCSSLALGNDVKTMPPEDLDGSGDDEDFSGSGMASSFEEVDSNESDVSLTSVAPPIPTVTQMSTAQKPYIAVGEETQEENVTQHAPTTKPEDPIEDIFAFEKEPAVEKEPTVEEGTTLAPTTEQTPTVESGIDIKKHHHHHHPHTTIPVTTVPAEIDVAEETTTSPAKVEEKPFVAHEETTTSTPDEIDQFDLVPEVTPTPEESVQHVHPETTSGLTSTPYVENEEEAAGPADVDEIPVFVETTTVIDDSHIHKHHHHPHHTTTSATEIPLEESDILIETIEKSDNIQPDEEKDPQDVTTPPTPPPKEDEHHHEPDHKHHKHHHHTTTPEATQSTVHEQDIVHTHEPKGRRVNVPAVGTTTGVPVLSEDDEPVDDTTAKSNHSVLTQDEDNLDSAEAESGDGPLNKDDIFFEEAPIPQDKSNRVEAVPGGGGDGSADASHGIMERKELLAGIIAGGLAGLVFAASLVAFVFYRMKKKDEGSYSLEEPKQSNGGYQKPREQREFYA